VGELLEKLLDEARGTWRFRWVAISIAFVIALLGWATVSYLPDRFEARASIFVDTRTALKPALQGLTVEQDVNVQLNYVRQSLLSGLQLERIAKDSGLLEAGTSDPREISKVLDALAKDVVLDARSASARESERDFGSVYTFTYQNTSRDVALRVTEVVLRNFVEETLGGKRQGTETAQRFLVDQIRDYEERLKSAESRLAEFKKANLGLMPTEQGGYFAQLQAEMDLVRRAENDLRIAESRRAELGRQLRGDAVVGAAGSNSQGAGPSASGATDTVSRLREAQARLDELLLRFTDKHPDVLAARATLAELGARREAEIESLRRGDANAAATSGVSNNPVYQSIRLQLNQADVEIASLRGQIAQHREKASDLRQRLDTAPEVEAEFAQLNRDYDINKAQYTALLASYEKSQLGEKADTAGSVRFEIVQPPTAPYVPVFPPRILILVAVLLASLAIGVAVAFVMHLIRPVVGSIRGLSGLTDAPILGVVGPAFPREHKQEVRRQLLMFSTAAALLLLCFASVIVMDRMGLRLG